jgi:hypothetical protein
VDRVDDADGGAMSGAIIYTPATGADWATAWEQVEYTRKGKMGLSLTNYDNTSLPAIASGSWTEVAGSIYKWTSEEVISGSLSSSAINYIKLVPSGSGDTAIVTATWTASAPTWSDSYQGWYNGTSRYIAAIFYDGTYYLHKSILKSMDSLPKESWYDQCLVTGVGYTATSDGGYVTVPSGQDPALAVVIPPRCIITAWSLNVDSSLTTGARLYYSLYSSATYPGTQIGSTLTTTGESTGLSYDWDGTTNEIYVKIGNTSGSSRTVAGIRVKCITFDRRY